MKAVGAQNNNEKVRLKAINNNNNNNNKKKNHVICAVWSLIKGESRHFAICIVFYLQCPFTKVTVFMNWQMSALSHHVNETYK